LLLDFVLLLAPKLGLKAKAPIKILSLLVLLLIAGGIKAQYKVKGTIYDSSRIYRIEAVTVMSTGGGITMSDSLGHYQIGVSDNDSVWFSYQGKPTRKYAVLKIPDINQFDISIRLKTDIMEEVKIRNRSYKLDSVQNRKDYAKIFDFHRPTVGSMTSIGPTGAGIDLDELIRLFQFKKNRATQKFQQRLLEQERDKFVDHRFNKALVRKLTGLDGEELSRFMAEYRPTYEFASMAGEYDFQIYIKRAFEQFRGGKSF
jgi:hypothetical protein